MPERHFQRPGNARPESQRRQKGRGQAQIVFHKERAHDAGEPGNTGRHVHHEGRQVGQLEVAGEFQNIAVDPVRERTHTDAVPPLQKGPGHGPQPFRRSRGTLD